MSSDKTRAAERLRDLFFGQIDWANASLAAWADVETICGAYLREHPADDAEPVTEEWLRAVGGHQEEHPSKITFHRNNALDIGLWNVSDGWKAMLIHSQSAASCIVRGLKTRGDVRRLCRALGIEPKEQSK